VPPFPHLRLLSSVRLPLLFFNDPATPEIYTLSLHDALPIYRDRARAQPRARPRRRLGAARRSAPRHGRRAARGRRLRHRGVRVRSEEHTSELQSLTNLVCRLLLEKKKRTRKTEDAGTVYHVR